jgi:hypothetical protein
MDFILCIKYVNGEFVFWEKLFSSNNREYLETMVPVLKERPEFETSEFTIVERS